MIFKENLIFFLSVVVTVRSSTVDEHIVGKICQYGGYCSVDDDCGTIATSTISSTDEKSYTIGNGCIENFGAECTDNSVCCDPGASCNNNPFRQCSQPSISSFVCRNPSEFPKPKRLKEDWDETKICQFSSYCWKDSDCVPGNKCNVKNMYYSECVPDLDSYKITNECIPNRGASCDDNSLCCDPGSYCNHERYRQCVQPVGPSNLCRSPKEFDKTPERMKISNWKNKICQYSAYCQSDGDCVPGNRCIVQNEHFSQCVPDKASYSDTMQCLSNWSEPCDDTSVCCDPGAICNRKEFRQCSQPAVPDCKSPIGYPDEIQDNPSTSRRTASTNKICQYSSYCIADEDCTSGSKCLKQSSYYSQCIPDPSQYLSSDSSCKANWGDQCFRDADCCDPGAFCNEGKTFKQCSQPTEPDCKSPDGFKT